MNKRLLPDGISIRWFGHATFEITGDEGQKFLIDPYLKNNPKFPKQWMKEVMEPGAYQALVVTHPHSDHFEDVMPMLENDADLKVICQFELGGWMKKEGIKDYQVIGMNTGGSVVFENVTFTMVNAVHTSSIVEKKGVRALGFPIGYVMQFGNGFTIYNTGDTAVTMDMQIVRDLYRPDLVILPIGDFYTMGAKQAAYALNMLRPLYAIGGHWGTWNGMPPGTPEALEKELARYKIHTQLIQLKPAESLT